LTQQAKQQKLPRTLLLLKRVGLYKESPMVAPKIKDDRAKDPTKPRLVPNPYATSGGIVLRPLTALAECNGFIIETEATPSEEIAAKRLLCARTATAPDPQNFPRAVEDAATAIQKRDHAGALRITNFWPSSYRPTLAQLASQRAHLQTGVEEMVYQQGTANDLYANPYVTDVVGPRLLPNAIDFAKADKEKIIGSFEHNDGHYRETSIAVEIPAMPSGNMPGGGFRAR
jgi:hypothetical protein